MGKRWCWIVSLLGFSLCGVFGIVGVKSKVIQELLLFTLSSLEWSWLEAIDGPSIGQDSKILKTHFKTQKRNLVKLFIIKYLDSLWFETLNNIGSSHKNPNIFNLALLVGKQCLETNHLFRKCYGSSSLFVSAFHKKTIKIFMNTKPLIRNQMMNHYSVRKTHQHLLCASHVSKSVCAGADCYSSTFLRVFEMHRTSSKSISVWFWQLLTLIWKSLQIPNVAFVDFFEMSNVTSDFVCRAKKMSNAKVLIW